MWNVNTSRVGLQRYFFEGGYQVSYVQGLLLAEQEFSYPSPFLIFYNFNFVSQLSL